MSSHRTPLSALPSVRQLRAFVAVYQTRHVSAAADQLALTQPAVTVLIRELEARLGVGLFDRGPRGMVPTEAAAEALSFAQRVLGDLQAMGSTLGDFARAGRGRVRVVATPAIAQALLPQAARRFLDAHPSVQLVIEDCAPPAFCDTLLSGRAHLGVGTLEAPVPGLAQRPLLREQLVAVALADAGLPDGGDITWQQLSAHPVITVKAGYGIRRSIDEAARAAGATLHVAHEVSLLATAVALAASGLGAAVVPHSAFSHGNHPDLQARRIVGPAVERCTSLVYPKDRCLSPAAEAFALVLASGCGNG